MREVIKKVPIPTAGVALGLAALGNLLVSYTAVAHAVCGVLACVLVGLLGAKIVLFPDMIRDDLRNSIMASVSATLFMSLMQLATYLAPLAQIPAFALWACAVVAHLSLMVWFSLRFIRRFKLHEVFPTYFICYVGIIVASVTAPVFGMEALGYGLFWLGFACYAVLLVLVTYRYVKHEIPEGARPLFCIYAAPMSLSLVGYLACSPDPSPLFVGVLLVLAQALFVVVLTRLPHLMALKFYPSFAAMTFPFVITATALTKGVAFLGEAGVALPGAGLLPGLIAVETLFAAFMVLFVLGHYARFLLESVEHPKAAAVVKETQMNAHFAENFEN